MKPKLVKTIIEVNNEKLVCEYLLASQNAIIIHGAGKAERTRYYPTAQQLINRGVGVALFDLSGHGESTGKLSELSLQKRQDQVAAVIKKVIPSDSVLYLIGFSMGAQTVCDLLPYYGSRTSAILLACPAIYRSDIREISFGEPNFTRKIREAYSWRDTLATKYLKAFSGKTVVAIGAQDGVIPKEVPKLIIRSAKHPVYKEYASADHALAKWLSKHPKQLTELITDLIE